MSFDWTHSFCLTCDKQTDGTTYCSESCRLAEYEQSSSPSSGASSPSYTGPSCPWLLSKPASTTTSNQLYLPPAYDFNHTQPYGAHQNTRQGSLGPPTRVLSPSSSHTSLCSIKSTSSATTEASMQLSEKARRELMAYSHSFENVKLQRRRSQ